MDAYDCTADVKAHMEKVRYWMRNVSRLLDGRAEIHDESKLKEPEKSMFDQYTYKLKATEFGSDEYKAQLVNMGGALKHHYANNRHHPEHYPNGINGMTLVDVVEMYCDWLAACESKHTPVDLVYLAKRFGIGEQLAQIILNTLRDDDFWNVVNGVPVTWFAPRTVDAPTPCDACGSKDLMGSVNGFPCWRCGQLWIEANLAKESNMDGLRTGRVVDYVLTAGDCREIEQQRKGAHLYGNSVAEGDHVPAVVVANWGSRDNQNPAVNLKLLLDGPDTYWATSRIYSEEPKPGTWHWLERI